MGKTIKAARKPAPAPKRAVRAPSKAPKKAAKRTQVGEREPVSGGSAPKTTVDRRYFGAPPKGATHVLLTKHSPNGSSERCFVNRAGVAEEKLPIAYASVEKLRRLWGPGTYRGQWLAIDHGKWKGLGRMPEVRILPHVAEEAAPRAASRQIGDVVATDESGEVPPTRALVPREPDEVVDLRLRAEREISTRRIEFERELAESRMTLRLDELRSENERRLRDLEARIEAAGDDDDDEPSPWAWLMPLLERLRPSLEELVPQILAKAVAAKGA